VAALPARASASSTATASASINWFIAAGSRAVDLLSHRLRRGAPGMAAGKQAAAEKSAFQRKR
jgi:hypothetical protein